MIKAAVYGRRSTARRGELGTAVLLEQRQLERYRLERFSL